MSNSNIDKRKFWRYVNLKLNRLIHFAHVYGIIIIFFDEMFKDLIKGKDIKIFNFGKFSLKKTKPRKYFDVRYQKVMESKGNKILKFNFSEKIKNKIYQHLDIDKTFESDKNE